MTQENATVPTTAQDLFDLSRLRLSQDFASTIGVKKALITVPVRKPARQEFFRVHPDPDWRLETAVIEVKEDRETYLVDPSLWKEIPGEIVPKALFTTVTRQGVVSIWPVRLPGEDGRQDEWSRSAIEAAQMATQDWVRLVANMSLGAYDVYVAAADIPEPVWPEVGFKKLLEIAFKDKYITSPDHPVIRKLRGEI